MVVREFRIEIAESVLDDLRERLARTRWPGEEQLAALGDDGAAGPTTRWMRGLLEHWRDRFDWRLQERALNTLPQVLVDAGAYQVHAVQMRGRGPEPLPLLLCHGWPGSFVDFTKVIPRLTDPVAFGGAPADAFTVVVPSLPGYLFSSPLRPGCSAEAVSRYAG